MNPASVAMLSAAFARGRADPRDVLARALADIEAGDPQHAVFVALTASRAREAAAQSAARWREGRPLGPLDGVPIAWKDVFDMAGVVTRCGSPTRDDAPPAACDAALVQALQAQGMVSLGKTGMSELAYSGLGINAAQGTPANPWDRTLVRVPGGSSSGSGVAVARGWVPCAMGSDTSGSVRVPAAFLGLVGFKPSHGRYSTRGMFPLAPSLDVAGPLAQDVEDIGLIDQALTGQARAAVPALCDCRVVVPAGRALVTASAEVAEVFANALARLRRAGVRVVERRFDPFEQTRALFERDGTLVAVEATEVHRDLLQSERIDRVDPRIAQRMRLGAALPAANAARIRAARAPLMAQAVACLAEDEVLLYPTVGMTAPAQAPLDADPEAFAACNLRVLHNTMLASYLDMPTLSLPAGLAADGMPVGLSVSTGRQRDLALLAFGQALAVALRGTGDGS